MEGMPQNSFTNPKPVVLEKKARPQEQLNCPRCNSTNTKFCYYNNYSLTQPRYFCKTCRRYWTEGGSLRNIPVGGGSRKNKTKVTTSTSSSTPSPKILDLNPPLQGFSTVLESSPGLKDPSLNHNRSQINQSCTISIHQNPKLQGGGQDLNLAFPTSSLSAPPHHELLRTGIMDSRGLNSSNVPYVPSLMMPGSYSNLNYPSGFSMQEETKPSMMGFSVDGLGNRSYGVQENDNNGGRLLLPFGGVKQISGGAEVDQNNKEQGNSTGFWTGMIGEGSW